MQYQKKKKKCHKLQMLRSFLSYFLFLLIFLVMYCVFKAKKICYFRSLLCNISWQHDWQRSALKKSTFFFFYLTHPQSWQWSSKFWDFRRHQKVLTCERWLFKKFKCWDRSVNLVNRTRSERIYQIYWNAAP